MEIIIPYQYQPRNYQLPILKAIDDGFKRIIQLWHRRSGKEKTGINIIAKKAFERIGAYYYIFPTYNQGKKILWNGTDKNGFRFINHIPKELRKRTVGNEMFIELVNGSTFQVVGSDNIDTIVGTNPLGVIFSEYSLQDPKAWDFLRPILAENGGWAIFNFTARGKNHAYRLLEYAKTDKKWFVSELNVDNTNAISKEVLEQERKEIIAKDGDESFFLQEYYNNFDAAIRGSYYGKNIEQARKEQRITKAPYDENLLVHTWWDLGIGDSTTIGFFQVHNNQWRLIDYYESSGEGLRHYRNILKEKNYSYGKHYAPHDIVVKELGTGRSRLEVAKELGINFETTCSKEGKVKSAVPNLPIDEGIDAVRRRFSTLWIDEKCERFLDAISQYRKEWNENTQDFKNSPLHDWTSHAADMLRYWAVTKEPATNLRPNKIYTYKTETF